MKWDRQDDVKMRRAEKKKRDEFRNRGVREIEYVEKRRDKRNWKIKEIGKV